MTGDLRAVDVVREQLCTSVCLLAAGGEQMVCSCVCRGVWHGALGAVIVPGTAGHRAPAPPPQPGPHLLDLLTTDQPD